MSKCQIIFQVHEDSDSGCIAAVVQEIVNHGGRLEKLVHLDDDGAEYDATSC